MPSPPPRGFFTTSYLRLLLYFPQSAPYLCKGSTVQYKCMEVLREGRCVRKGAECALRTFSVVPRKPELVP